MITFVAREGHRNFIDQLEVVTDPQRLFVQSVDCQSFLVVVEMSGTAVGASVSPSVT